jgi:putative peptide zinc metalloprotease protein
MPTAAPAASDVERRKKVKILMRRDLSIAPQKYEGRTYYVVKDPVSLRYYRFKEQEHFLIKLMDGSHTLDDAQKDYEKRFRPERLTLEDLEGFAQQLLTAGLAQNESPQAGKQLFDRRKKRLRSEWMQTLTNILYIKIPVYDPDKLLAKMVPYSRWIFTTWFLTLSIGVMLAAIMLVATHFSTFWDRLPAKQEFFSFKTVVYLWVALGAVKIIHEFGHGLSCKVFGGEVHEMGALFLVFSPCLYCNVSDAWTLPSKWKRIIISSAGIYVELVIAAIATFVWWNTPAQPFVNNLCLSLMVVCSVSTVFFNANPLMRYDGYYMLADWLEIPNLRDRSNRYLQRLFMDYCLGIEVQPEQYMALWRRILFVAYAVISYIYRWVITFSILWWMSQFLEPYRLKVVSQMLAVGAAASMVGWPLYRLGKNLHKRGRLPDMKPARVTLSALALATVLFVVFLVPLPVSRVRDLGLVQVQQGHIESAVIRIPGTLERLYVLDGQHVSKGDRLADFRSIELENQMAKKITDRNISRQEADTWTIEAAKNNLDSELRKQLHLKIAEALHREQVAGGEAAAYQEQIEGLKLRAPCDGVVMVPPMIDDIGKLYDKGTTFCRIGDQRYLRVLVPVSPSDYRILRRDFEEKQKALDEMAVDIRVQGRAERVWHGRLLRSELPESEAKGIPVQLSNKGGGNVAVDPSAKPDPLQPQSQNQLKPQSQQYLVPIEILDSDGAICPGTMAQVKIHCRWQTAAWWAWRTFSSAFDLGMEPTDLLPVWVRSSE